MKLDGKEEEVAVIIVLAGWQILMTFSFSQQASSLERSSVQSQINWAMA